MQKFLAKNSLYFTTVVGIVILIYLITQWSQLAVMQRLVCFIFISLTAHEWEENLFGFGDLNAQNLGVSVEKVDEGIGHFALFLLTLYIGVVPLFFPQLAWMSATSMVLGLIELFSHIAAIRMSSKKGYSAGLVTAFTVLPFISIYGFHYIISNHLIQSSIEWLYAFLNLFIPLICAQYISVRALGVNYREFLKNAFSAMSKSKKV